jgi:hypothetical protein
MGVAYVLGEEALALREERVDVDLFTIGSRRSHL